MMDVFEEESGSNAVSAVVISNRNTADECVLYSSDATDEELETMWIRAEEGDYTTLAASR